MQDERGPGLDFSLCFVCGSRLWRAAALLLCLFICIIKFFKCSPVPASFFPIYELCYSHLYSMAEISFHRFHMCKGKKQTNIKNAQSNTHSHSSPLPLLPFSDPTTPLPPTTIPLPLPGNILFSFWFFVVLHPQNQFKEVFFTLCCWCNGKSFNTWLLLQLRLESAIYKYFSDLLLKSAYLLLQYFI